MTACADCGKELSGDDLASSDPSRCDSCETQASYDAVSASPPETLEGVVGVLVSIGWDEQRIVSEVRRVARAARRATRTRTYLDVRYDVTDLDSQERGQLALEAQAQAEDSDGHPSVEVLIEWNEVEETIYQANVLGQDLIDVARPVEAGLPPLPVGEEGVVVMYGDALVGVTVHVSAPDEDEAEARILRTFGIDASVDEIVPTVEVRS